MDNDSANQRSSADAAQTAKPDHEVLDDLVDDFTRRIRDGEYPSIAEYQEKYPHLKDDIDELLSSVAMIEQLKSESASERVANGLMDKVAKLERIGAYRIVQEVGRGGMGVVFEAVHESLGRRVAIKVLPTPAINAEKHVERFRREAQAAARLHHTNIVGVFGVGEGEGFYYYVMDFVDGISLNHLLRRKRISRDAKSLSGITKNASGTTDATQADSTPAPFNSLTSPHDQNGIGQTIEGLGSSAKLDYSPQPLVVDPELEAHVPEGAERFRWAAGVAANIADALHYAHEHRILHRDIKPGNLILDRSGTVWVTDFGLAKDAGSEINLTKTGDVIGTPQYLAPESLEGKYDQRSETYCLGLTLYELALNRPAYSAATTPELICAIATTSPPSPRKIDPRFPKDLATVIEKAVARDPDARYQTPEDLRNDLQAFADDRPISARRPSALEQASRWSRRNPLAAALAGISMALLTLVAVLATWGYVVTTDALEESRANALRLKEEQKETATQRDRAIENEKRAIDNEKQMAEQYARAEANIEVTLEAFDEMFKQVINRNALKPGNLEIDGFREIAGLEPSVTEQDIAFLEKLLEFYEEFAEQNADNEALAIESAKAFRRVGNIYGLVGDAPEAMQAYDQSARIYRALNSSTPFNKRFVLPLCEVQNEQSLLLRGRQEGTRTMHQLTRETIALLESQPTLDLDPELRFELARTLNVMGTGLAMHTARTSTVPDENKVRPQNKPPNRRNASDRPNGPGDRDPGRRPQGPPGAGDRPHIQRAIGILDDLILENPENDEYRSVRASCFCSLAAIGLLFDRRRSDANQLRQQAIKELDSLLERDPANAEYQFMLALTCAVHDRIDTPEDFELIKRTVQITQDLSKRFPNVLEYTSLSVTSRIKAASYEMFSGETIVAYNQLVEVTEIIEQASRTMPSSLRVFGRSLYEMSRSFDELAVVLEIEGDTETADLAAAKGNQLRKQFGRLIYQGLRREGGGGRQNRDGPRPPRW